MKNVIAIVLMVFSTVCYGATEPREGRFDPRIKTVEYTDGRVYRVTAHYYQSSLIMLSERENIIHISAGDGAAWQINPVNNYVSVKPIMEKADSNMNILTENEETGEVRSYVFELVALRAEAGVKDKNATFMLKFTYPEDELKRQMALLAQKKKKTEAEVIEHRKIAAADWNMEYTYAGTDALVPVRTFDDGVYTYFQFPENMDTPAIFLVDEKGNESLVNYHVSGKYIVVQRVGSQFMLRDGDRATCIFNNAFSNGSEQTTMTQASKGD